MMTSSTRLVVTTPSRGEFSVYVRRAIRLYRPPQDAKYADTCHLASTIDLANTTYSCNDNPKGIDLNPNGYTTRELFGWGTQVYDTDPQNFTWYDEFVTRPVPMVLSTNIDGTSEAKVVCIAMDEVKKGSRVPPESVNNGEDNESAAVGLEWKSRAGMATLMAGVAAMYFVLA
jgi:hypothetical protein